MQKSQNIQSLSPSHCGPLRDTKTSKFLSHSFSRCNYEKLIRTLQNYTKQLQNSKIYDQDCRSLKQKLKHPNLTIFTVNYKTQVRFFFWGLRKLIDLNQVRTTNFLSPYYYHCQRSTNFRCYPEGKHSFNPLMHNVPKWSDKL